METEHMYIVASCRSLLYILVKFIDHKSWTRKNRAIYFCETEGMAVEKTNKHLQLIV